jgi:hypothetical protein
MLKENIRLMEQSGEPGIRSCSQSRPLLFWHINAHSCLANSLLNALFPSSNVVLHLIAIGSVFPPPVVLEAQMEIDSATIKPSNLWPFSFSHKP